MAATHADQPASNRLSPSMLLNTANEYILFDSQLAIPEFLVEIEYIFDKVVYSPLSSFFH